MKRIVFSESGFTLIEIITVLVISTLLILVSAVGLSVFFGRYQELNAYIELQKDAVEFMDYLKNGYYMGTGNNLQFCGIASATGLEITGRSEDAGKGTGIMVTPPRREEYPHDFVHYYLHEGVIRANYMYYGVQVNTPAYLFPKRVLKDQITIESFKIGDANAYNALFPYKTDEALCAVTVELRAKVKVMKDTYRTVEFSTVMAMKNMERPQGGTTP